MAVTAALQERLGRFADHGDYAAVLDPEALKLGCAVLAAACVPGLTAADTAALVYQVAWLRWFRCDALSTGPDPDRQRAEAEEETALRLFTVLHWIQPELVPPSLAAGVTALAQAGLSQTPADRDAALGDALLGLARSAGDPDGITQSLGRYRRVLESGGLLWSQLLQTRGEIDDLRAADPHLAERLAGIRASLDGQGALELTDGRPSLELPASQRLQAAVEWDDLLAEIRARPGFESFLDVPSFGRLSAVAVGGPVVVINVSQYRCDALAVTPKRVRVIRLPELTLADAERHASALRQAQSQADDDSADAMQKAIDAALPWLWHAITAPVLRELSLLRTHDRRALSPLPRIWWCPTGPLTHLPLHAAAPGPVSRGTIDHVVSSYTPTLRTLLRAAPATPRRDARQQRLLLVTIPETPALPGHRLPGTVSEAKAIRCSFHGKLTTCNGPDASTALVAGAMAGHDHAHFACHGIIDPQQPDQSGLRLYDGVLTIGALSRLRRQSPGLAFLSACDTAAGSSRHPDEVITMAAAMHMAGFEHVIATMWYIADSSSRHVARRVYGTLSTPVGRLNLDDTAGALHAAARDLRGAGFPAVQWAPYVHSGP
ncbi:MAG: CHAT domain-containing protein [Streptosporangiaceae bacterium]